MDIEQVERVLRLIAELKLEGASLMWAAIAYFVFGFLKSLMGFVVLGALGIYWAKTVRWLVGRRSDEKE